MALDRGRARRLLGDFDLQTLFVEELGWDRAPRASDLAVVVDGETYRLSAVAQKRGLIVLRIDLAPIPPHALRRKIETQVARSYQEHLIIFTDRAAGAQVWQWVRREPGRPLAQRELHWDKHKSEALLQRLEGISFSLEEEEKLTLVDATSRVRATFDMERATKKFYDQFKKERDAFEKFLDGIPDAGIEDWYVSVMLNRLMFIYFIQEKGFLDGNQDYLSNHLAESQARGEDRYYRDFLCPLFFQGFALPEGQRPAEARALLGKVPYLNGGIFQRHEVEELYGAAIRIPDAAFARLFAFFRQYQWHLDDRPLRSDREINADVLGYIFEKYINQKQMGAYYTKEDITEYISKNTILPFLLDEARKGCRVAFEGEPSVWALLAADPNRYIYPAVRHGAEHELPTEIAAGLEDVAARGAWNSPTPEPYALPTEIWRETVARRQRYEEVRAKLAAGELREVNDLITLNLDIRQFAQDVIEQSEGPELLRAFWRALNGVTVLDPTCGSGAFLFAALNILEPLYEGCLRRMQALVDDLGLDASPLKYRDFRDLLARVATHPSEPYFVLKSIVVQNLYGVDIMPEAVEIAKLRLFLKLVSQVERVEHVEPLPDIDFNIRAGNTLVGFATREEVFDAIKRGPSRGPIEQQRLFQLQSEAVQERLFLLSEDEEALRRITEAAEDADHLFTAFRKLQVGNEEAPTGSLDDALDAAETKYKLRHRLTALEEELNIYLARDYGIDTKNGAKFGQWRASHQPFHWFIEFYGILKEGGFDVIIGNPPYATLSSVTTYALKGFSTTDTRNLYPLILERGLPLTQTSGRSGYIVPISSISTDGYSSLQSILLRRSVHASSFDDRPARLFDGLEHIQLTIWLIQNRATPPASYFTSEAVRWNANERNHLFALIRYENANKGLFRNSLPKIGSSLESSLLEKIFGDKLPIAAQTTKQGAHVVYYSRKVHNFLQAVDFVPEVYDGDGNLRAPTELKPLRFTERGHRDIVFCLLNSSLFRWFINVFSDCRHVNRREVDGFPINLPEAVTQHNWEELASTLSESLSATSEFRTMRFSHDTLRIQCIIPKLSKPIIDVIDRVLARHYGFTDEELDFIINYDIKYRMGSALFGGAGDEEAEA